MSEDATAAAGPQDVGPQLADALTIWATSATLPGSAGRDLALVILTPSFLAYTSDEHPADAPLDVEPTGAEPLGAEPIDIVTTSLQASGFGPLREIAAPELEHLPALQNWHAMLAREGPGLRIVSPDGAFYDGDLGAGELTGWRRTAVARGTLAVLWVRPISVAAATDAASLVEAARAGRVLAATLPVRVALD